MAGRDRELYAIGIDIGGTKIAAGLVNIATGAVSEKRLIATVKTDAGETALNDALRLAQELRETARGQGSALCGIGVGVPELVGPDGNIKSDYNFAWSSQDVQALFARLAPACVESDVRAAARAEMRFGGGRGYRHSIYIGIGTGISYCLCIDGRPYAGAKGNAIHFASSALYLRCESCRHIQRPVIEEIASGPALLNRFNAITGESLSRGEQLFAAADAGRAEAVEVISTAADSLGALIGLVINMLDPEIVIIGGGIGLAGGLFGARLVAATRQHIWAEDCRNLPVKPAGLGLDAGLIGAALTASARS